MPAPIKTTLYTDPGCPWAYSAIPRAPGARVALRLAARLAPGHDRSHRERRAVQGPRLHPAPLGPRLGELPPLRHAVRPEPEEPRLGDRPGLPRHRAPPASSGRRVAGAARAAALPVLHPAGARGRRAPQPRSSARRSASRRRDPRGARLRRGDRGLPARPRRVAQRRRSPAELPGQDRDQRRAVRYTAPSVVFERDGQQARRRRAGSRSRPTTSWSRTSTRRSTAAPPPRTPATLIDGLPHGPDDPGGHGAARARQRRAGSRRRRARPARPGRRGPGRAPGPRRRRRSGAPARTRPSTSARSCTRRSSPGWRCDEGRDLVGRDLPVVLHRQAPLRAGARAVRRTATRSRSCGAASSSIPPARASRSRRSSGWRRSTASGARRPAR